MRRWRIHGDNIVSSHPLFSLPQFMGSISLPSLKGRWRGGICFGLLYIAADFVQDWLSSEY